MDKEITLMTSELATQVSKEEFQRAVLRVTGATINSLTSRIGRDNMEKAGLIAFTTAGISGLSYILYCLLKEK